MRKKLIRLISLVGEPINWYKTVRFNFMMLPFKQALHLPVFIYGKANIKYCTGKVVINSEKIHTGSIRFGANRIFGNLPTEPISSFIDIEGTLIVGEHASFGNRLVLKILPGAVLDLESDVSFGGNCKIYCQQNIHVGRRTMVSWDCQFFDTNFHYLMNDKGEIKKKWQKIYIGEYCWIGNRVSLNKGSYLPSGTIVASNSLVNKSFLNSKGAVIAGIPGKVVSEGNRHVWNVHGTEWKVDNWFTNNPDLDQYAGTDIELFE